MNTLRSIALALLLVGAASGALAAPAMWSATGPRGKAVLFGSIHLLPTGLAWRTPELDAAIAGADEVWFEIPIDDQAGAQTAKLMAARGALPAGDTLAAHLPPALLRRLEADAGKLGVAPSALRGLRPWMADAMMSIAADARSGAQADQGVERRIDALTPAGVSRRAFETAAEQVAMLAGDPEAEQVRGLATTLDEIERHPGSYDRLVAAWNAGDLKTIAKEILAPMRAEAPATFRRLILDRNRGWADVIAERLSRPGIILVVVGAGHLIGPQGVPSLLRARGVAVAGP